jgi:ADP-heptose:LPS heptosyltransferase
MTVKSIQYLYKIDQWIGRCLCFLLTVVYRFIGFFQKPTYGIKTKSILIIQLSELGSIILAYPALKKLFHMYEDSKICLLTFDQQQPLINVLPFDNNKIELLTISTQTIPGFCYSLINILFYIWKKSFDMVIDFERFSRFSSIISGLTFAPVRAGFSRYSDEGLYRGNFLTHAVWYNNYLHASINFVSMVRSLECEAKTQPIPQIPVENIKDIPSYQFSESKIKMIRKTVVQHLPKASKSDLWVLFNVSSGHPLPIRSWPLNYYESLAKLIFNKYNAIIILSGQKDACQNAKFLTEQLGAEYCWDATDQFDLDELMHLLGNCNILVTPDSGMAHLASMTEIQSIVLFGPETPIRYSPLGHNHIDLFADFLCSPCFSPHNHCLTSCKDAKCLQAITPEDVFIEFQNIMSVSSK